MSVYPKIKSIQSSVYVSPNGDSWNILSLRVPKGIPDHSNAVYVKHLKSDQVYISDVNMDMTLSVRLPHNNHKLIIWPQQGKGTPFEN